MKKIVQKIVTLVKIPSQLSVLSYPKIGDYENPFILSTTPCEEKNGKYFDLLTEKEITKDENTLVWINLSGTVFQYPNGQRILITRRYRDNQLIAKEIAPWQELHPTMMLRQVVELEKKERY